MQTPSNAASPERPHARSIIGQSSQGRAIVAEQIGKTDASLRILLVAGQHGDERRPCRVLRRIVRRLTRVGGSGPSRRVLDALDRGAACITIVPCLNPDGYAQRRRASALGIDLNRDHQMLRAPETRALHQLVAAFRPQLVLDLHTYPARRQQLLEQRLIRGDDLCIDWPTNPVAAARSRASDLGPRLLDDLRRRFEGAPDGVRTVGRYFVLSSGGVVRHGTADVVDSRNALALRYGCLTLLLEGRQKTDREPASTRRQLSRMMRQGVESLLRWAEAHLDELAVLPVDAGQRVPIRCRYERVDAGFTTNFLEEATLRPVLATLPGAYKPIARATRHIRLPRAYAVPLAHVDLLAVLERHTFARWHNPAGLADDVSIEAYRLRRVRASRRAGLPPQRVMVRRVRMLISRDELLSQYAIFPADGPDAAAMAIHLEPHAKYALHREVGTSASLQPEAVGTLFPVLRLIATDTPVCPPTPSPTSVSPTSVSPNWSGHEPT